MSEKLYTTNEIAQIYRVHHVTVLRWIKNRKLSAVKIGDHYRIKESELPK